MKLTIFTSILIIFQGLTCNSQNIEALKTETKKVYSANYLMDFETIMLFSFPKMITTFGETVFLENVEKHYENSEFRLRLQLETVPFQYSEIRKLEGKVFCVITCRNPMRYFFESKLTTETAAEKAAWLKKINKTDDVTFEPSRNSFNVRKTSIFVAVSDETTNHQWKFFNFDDANQYEAFRIIFGESMQKELGL